MLPLCSSRIFLEFWKRKEITYSMRWGTQGYESMETDRVSSKVTWNLTYIH